MDVKSLKSFLGHAGFYRRFIKDLSKITKPLTQLLQKDVAFDFDKNVLSGISNLEKCFSKCSHHSTFVWSQSFEIMCDASDYVVGAVLGQ
jgi:hypothetical protein